MPYIFIVYVLFRQDFGGLEYSVEDNPVQMLGLQMIYCLQTVQLIDQLRDYHAKGKNPFTKTTSQIKTTSQSGLSGWQWAVRWATWDI